MSTGVLFICLRTERIKGIRSFRGLKRSPLPPFPNSRALLLPSLLSSIFQGVGFCLQASKIDTRVTKRGHVEERGRVKWNELLSHDVLGPSILSTMNFARFISLANRLCNQTSYARINLVNEAAGGGGGGFNVRRWWRSRVDKVIRISRFADDYEAFLLPLPPVSVCQILDKLLANLGGIRALQDLWKIYAQTLRRKDD